MTFEFEVPGWHKKMKNKICLHVFFVVSTVGLISTAPTDKPAYVSSIVDKDNFTALVNDVIYSNEQNTNATVSNDALLETVLNITLQWMHDHKHLKDQDQFSLGNLSKEDVTKLKDFIQEFYVNITSSEDSQSLGNGMSGITFMVIFLGWYTIIIFGCMLCCSDSDKHCKKYCNIDTSYGDVVSF
ncbi:unnamed protein product [Owenia fusiformis]|uniref:Uncharacterized protein n=1 Tax=Owenia fusiformis TaxID=6347 RepID=A0A8S4MWB5_OWEFU|nr:unnamed protein product [Owenia fusiformis]